IGDDVYFPIQIKYDTLSTLLNMREYLLSQLQNRDVKKTVFPDYNDFVIEIAHYIIENGGTVSDKLIEDAILAVIKTRYENNYILYEFFLKTPTILFLHVKKRISFFTEYNNYNFPPLL